MSYLLEKSTIVTKRELLDNEEEYYAYEKFEIDNHYIITDTEKPFFSMYDIAHQCKKKFPEDKLFLIVHRYFDTVRNEKITEFYIINSVDIFDDSLMSILSVSYDELIEKQHVVQNNLKIAMKLLGCDDFHIILGDNIKLHEVVEYVHLEQVINDGFEIFDEDQAKKILDENSELEELNNSLYENIKHSKISTILNSVRIIEPKSSKMKKTVVLLSLVVISLVGSKDISDMIFEDSLLEAKKVLKKERRKLGKISRDYEFKNNASFKLREQVKILNKQNLYNPIKDQK
jgi:hypothetical protein